MRAEYALIFLRKLRKQDDVIIFHPRRGIEILVKDLFDEIFYRIPLLQLPQLREYELIIKRNEDVFIETALKEESSAASGGIKIVSFDPSVEVKARNS